jgi:peptide/nickel transport system permease protein
MASYVVSNLVVLVLVALAVWAVRRMLASELPRAQLFELLRRRPTAFAVLGIYTAIALADSVAWTGGGGGRERDAIVAHEPRSVIDRVFEGSREKSYSAPLATKEFYRDAPLAHPGTHVLGTDILGRDVLYVTLKGARVALLIGGLTSLIAIPLALFFGVLAGYVGRWVDDAIFFVMTVLASIPSILLLVALILVLSRGTLSVCVALGVTSWVGFCRLARGETLKLRELDYVAAARTLGVSEAKIIFRHIVPNLMHLVVITFVLMFSNQVIAESVLSWLGIGVDGSWGQMIAQAKDELARDPIIAWNLGAAVVALFGLLLAVNLIGDAVRDVLDPRTLRERE